MFLSYHPVLSQGKQQESQLAWIETSATLSQNKTLLLIVFLGIFVMAIESCNKQARSQQRAEPEL